MRRSLLALVVALLVLPPAAWADIAVQVYALPPGGAYPHDVAVGDDGIVWYTAQRSGHLGRLDPATGRVELVPLGRAAAPHGVVIGPDGAPWVTEGGTNAIVRVDPTTRAVKSWALPEARGYVNLNTLTFDRRGRVWFTGQSGVYGRLDPASGAMTVWDAPRGRGPYGIATTPEGDVYYASLAGSHIARVDVETGAATVIEPPTKGQGARRVWSDSKGRIWVSEWHSGQVSRYDPKARAWKAWKLPGDSPRAYAVSSMKSTCTASNGNSSFPSASLRNIPAANSACTSPCTAFTSRPARRAASRKVIGPWPAIALISSQRLAVSTFHSSSGVAKLMRAFESALRLFQTRTNSADTSRGVRTSRVTVFISPPLDIREKISH